jgi:hypothetical protein
MGGYRIMKYLIVALSIFTLVAVGGCAEIAEHLSDIFECTGCDDDIDDMYDKYGAPEEIDTYDSVSGHSSYHSYTYWYWSRGFAYTFTWTGCLCDSISLYTF